MSGDSQPTTTEKTLRLHESQELCGAIENPNEMNRNTGCLKKTTLCCGTDVPAGRLNIGKKGVW